MPQLLLSVQVVAYYGISGVLSMAVFMPIGALLSLIVVSKGFRKIGSDVKVTTLAQWIGIRYESIGYALFFGFPSLLLITFSVLICVGMTQVLTIALGTEVLPTLICSVTFIFGYMMFGGVNSMVYTNLIQAFIKVLWVSFYCFRVTNILLVALMDFCKNFLP